jgi:hypothetical protein
MAKNSVTDWSSTAASNSDIGGIDIAENCDAANINNAIRELMAQIVAADGAVLKSGSAMSGNLTAMGSGSTVKDSGGTAQSVGFRNVPQNSQSSGYTLALVDVGKHVFISTGGVTVPPNSTVAFAVGDAVTIINNSGSDQTITQGSGVTLRRAGTSSTGNRSLAQRGLVTVIKVATDEWFIAGAGLS